MRSSLCVSLALGMILAAGPTMAQAPQAGAPAAASPPVLPYGLPIAMADARRAVEAALAEAQKTGFNFAVAIVGPAGDLIYFARMDNANISTSMLAQRKAQTAATFRRPSKLFEDRVQGGATYVLGLEGVIPVGGGVPLVMDGKIVGAIGASGGPTSGPDEQVAQAGAAALK